MPSRSYVIDNCEATFLLVQRAASQAACEQAADPIPSSPFQPHTSGAAPPKRLPRVGVLAPAIGVL